MEGVSLRSRSQGTGSISLGQGPGPLLCSPSQALGLQGPVPELCIVPSRGNFLSVYSGIFGVQLIMGCARRIREEGSGRPTSLSSATRLFFKAIISSWKPLSCFSLEASIWRSAWCCFCHCSTWLLMSSSFLSKACTCSGVISEEGQAGPRRIHTTTRGRPLSFWTHSWRE